VSTVNATRAKRVRPLNRVKPLSLAELIYFLREGEYTVHELAELTGLHENTIGEYLRAMHKRKVVYVAGWGPDARGGMNVREWSLGEQKDKPKPKAKSAVERQKNYRNRMKQAELNHLMAGSLTASQQD